MKQYVSPQKNIKKNKKLSNTEGIRQTFNTSLNSSKINTVTFENQDKALNINNNKNQNASNTAENLLVLLSKVNIRKKKLEFSDKQDQKRDEKVLLNQDQKISQEIILKNLQDQVKRQSRINNGILFSNQETMESLNSNKLKATLFKSPTNVQQTQNASLSCILGENLNLYALNSSTLSKEGSKRIKQNHRRQNSKTVVSLSPEPVFLTTATIRKTSNDEINDQLIKLEENALQNYNDDTRDQFKEGEETFEQQRKYEELINLNKQLKLKQLQLFSNQQLIKIFPCGIIITNKTPCFEINLSSYFKKYFLYTGSKEEHQPALHLVELQLDFYERAVQEIIEESSQSLGYLYGEQNPVNKSQKIPKKYKYLFTLDGQQVKNILSISYETKVLLVSEDNQFKIVDTKFMESIDMLEESKVKLGDVCEKVMFGKTQQVFSRNRAQKAKSQDQQKQSNLLLKYQKIREMLFLNKELKIKLPSIQQKRKVFNQSYFQETKRNFALYQDQISFGGDFTNQEIKTNTFEDSLTEIENNQNFEKTQTSLFNQKNTPNFASPTQNILSQALVQKRYWMQKFNLSSKTLYDLFSEYMSLLVISKADKAPSQDPLDQVLPINENVKMSQFFKQLKNQTNFNFGIDDFKDFKLPLNIFIEYSKVVKTQNPSLINKFLHAIGLEVYNPLECFLDWETFIFVNCLLKLFTASKEEYITFFVSVLDPYQMKKIKKEVYEPIIDSIFSSQFSAGIEDESNSLSADIKRKFKEVGIINIEEGDQLEIEKLIEGFRDNLIDIEIFKQALK